jgi:ABC-type Fe3+-hydroxamate transport system substrate-binding protein
MPGERTDWAGVTHDVAGDPPRIASLVPSLTETLFALGLGAQVIARTGFCIHPRDEVRRVPKIGGTKDPDLTRLRALAPTHLVVNVDENRREDVDSARAFVPHVIVTHPMGPEDNPRLLQLLGAIFLREAESKKLSIESHEALAALDTVAASLPRERALYLIWRKPWMTVARDTYVSRTLARAGFDTLPARSDLRYPTLDDEDAAWRDADRILLSTEPYAFRERDAVALRASTRKPVDLIDGAWTSWYGARSISGFRALASFRPHVSRAVVHRNTKL